MSSNSSDSASKSPIYLDYNATTPTDPKVLKTMECYFKNKFGNSASQTHSFGWEACAGIDDARTKVASLIGCNEKEIIWTSGATESNNLALIGLCRHLNKTYEKIHMITSTIEHKAVLDVGLYLEKENIEVSFVEPNKNGVINPDDVRALLKPHTKIMSFMFANNEVGSINPIAELGELAKENNIFFHVDAAQATGKVPMNVKKLNIDLLSVSGHKLYGPKGIGALYLNSDNKNLELEPLFYGGAQENGIRPGTLNVAGAVGMGRACEICENELEMGSSKYLEMRDYFLNEILKFSPKTKLNGHASERLPSHLSLTFYDVMPFELTTALMGVAYSTTSACSSGDPTVSYVLKAIGLSNLEARTTLRFGLGRFTKMDELDIVLDKLRGLFASKKIEFKEPTP